MAKRKAVKTEEPEIIRGKVIDKKSRFFERTFKLIDEGETFVTAPDENGYNGIPIRFQKKSIRKLNK